ncbi:MAG: bifunctional DNA-formamidopyrimidine glycosylase/DNA-(apurinic or apyrimidinic site) lyase [Acidobacteriota bacterium]|nr:bifunctional DNA-formamidopyrimidine glycosylase/DNA-(apurinic or apyrimidinic site) lyase [Acidobacteriota bacterium]
MPELPEVETVVRGLDRELRGKRLKDFVFLSQHLVSKQPATALSLENYYGKKIKKIWRRGKVIVFEFSGQLGLIVHLKMTGQLYFVCPDQLLDKHSHARMAFYGFKKELRFRDIRKFGYLNCLKVEEIQKKIQTELGPEPLEMNFQDFFSQLQRFGKKRIKGWLLDQKIIAGIGNIYSDEILFEAKISPERKTISLSPKEARNLYRAMKSVLKKAIELKGSSVSDYVDSLGQPGKFQKRHRVYGREGKPCFRCQGTTVQRKKICGRSAFFCPSCQS